MRHHPPKSTLFPYTTLFRSQRNKLRAFLTMLGIIIGVGAVIAMVAIGQGSKKSIQDQLSSMGSNMITIRPNSNQTPGDRKSTRLNSSHRCISYAVFCLKKKK